MIVQHGEESFSISCVGASHLPKNVPCQDYSLCYESEDKKIKLIVVCDGHGSPTYIRSQDGSKFAAEITKKCILEFVKKQSPELFLNRYGGVTACPEEQDRLWMVPPDNKELTEFDIQKEEQAEIYKSQIKGNEKQEIVLRALFRNIFFKWHNAIVQDSVNRPFSEKEKAALGKNEIEKAYGTTLQAYVQTPFYWLAFHIGDGRLLGADDFLNWKPLVPWDCNCFQNLTTSLCNHNPIESFRYAFDGTGDYFPTVVFSCSDGIEDSYGDYDVAPEKLHNFYSKLIILLRNQGMESFLSETQNFLPRLSEAGSKDDMSLAGVVDLEKLDNAIQSYQYRVRKNDMEKHHQEREEKELEEKRKFDKVNEEISLLQNEIDEAKKSEENLRDSIKNLFKNKNAIKKKIKEKEEKKDTLTINLNNQSLVVKSIQRENKVEDENEENEKKKIEKKENEVADSVKQKNDQRKKRWKENALKCGYRISDEKAIGNL